MSLKNPLAIILASIETIQNDKNMDDLTKQKFLDKIEKLKKILALIDKFRFESFEVKKEI